MMSHKVLIVDDNVDSARLLELLLASKGHHARCAADGAEALQVAAEQQPDLVLLDLSLPDLDGFELADRLRAMPGLAGIRLIAVTGWSDPEAAARARESGFEAFLVKPVNMDKLTALLAR
jgi:CheY-like chemotaxis protein